MYVIVCRWGFSSNEFRQKQHPILVKGVKCRKIFQEFFYFNYFVYICFKFNIMKNGIPSQHYYELLEWKDENMKEFIERYNNRRMCELTTDELRELYLYIKENRGDD